MKTFIPYHLKHGWRYYFTVISIWLVQNTFLNLQIQFSLTFIVCALLLPMSWLLKSINKNSAPGFAAQSLPNGYPRYPSFGDASSHPSSRHPSVGSARLPSVGEESTHPLLVAEEQVSMGYLVTAIMNDLQFKCFCALDCIQFEF